MQDTQVQSLGQEDPLEEGNGNPFQYFLPGKSHEQRSLQGYSPWGRKRVRHDLATKKQPKIRQAISPHPNFADVVDKEWHFVNFISVQSLSPVTSGFPVHHQLPELTQTHVHRVSEAIQPSHSLSSASPPTFNLSQHQGLSNELVFCIRWPKYWSFSLSMSPSDECSGLIPIVLDSILKSRDITQPTKVHLVKAMLFPVVMYGCESWTMKKAEH